MAKKPSIKKITKASALAHIGKDVTISGHRKSWQKIGTLDSIDIAQKDAALIRWHNGSDSPAYNECLFSRHPLSVLVLT